MAEKSRGSTHGARKKLKKEEKTTINDRLKDFEKGEDARIKIDPSVQDGRPHTRFHGRDVKIKGKRGDAYKVKFKDGKKEKVLFINPAHLQKEQVK
ncbi:MAG: 50S ribosomal protein L21e [Candidatus Nanohaloarchaea archaeon]